MLRPAEPDSSMYVIAFFAFLVASATPEVPLAASPTWNGKVCEAGAVQTSGAFAARYSVKFWVVPESSERCTTVIGADGSEAPEFWPLILASSHVVILPEKMPAMVAASSLRSFTPSTLYAMAIGEM